MINFVVTKDHRYPMKKMLDGKLGKLPFDWKQWSYEDLLRTRKINNSTWIFQDIERLTDSERIRVSSIAARLELNGARIINHPVHATSRYALLRRLFEAGINDFQVYRADEYRTPNRWPVFIRFEANHRSPNPQLIYSKDELTITLQKYLDSATPLSSLLIVEYCGEPGKHNLWCKFSAYRVGNEIIHHHIVRQDSWVAKYGNPNLNFNDETWLAFRTEEEQFVVHDKNDPLNLLHMFNLANIEFGRADFSFVGGKTQIYEINTNPTIGVVDSAVERFQTLPREPILRYANNRIVDALLELDTLITSNVSIADINYIKSLPWRPAKRP